MDDKRKNAYRYLLYQAMLDIRPIAWQSSTFLQRWNPLAWRWNDWRTRQAGLIADWLHNLALFSALDFVNFSEDEFWREWKVLSERNPDFRLQSYKERFDHILSELPPKLVR